MVSAISSHYSRRHWYMCFTSIQNIGLVVCYACLSNPVSSSTPHTHTLSKNSLGQAGGSFSDIWVWYRSVARSAGLAGCVYTALLIDSLSLSQRNLAGQERQRCTFDCVHLVHIRIGVIGLSVGPVKSGWSFPQFWVYLTPSQAWGLSRVIGAVNLEEQRWYS